MFKSKSNFIKDFFCLNSRDFSRTYVESFNKNILNQPLSEVQLLETKFIDKYLMDRVEYKKISNATKIHFNRQIQGESLCKINLTNFNFIFKDIGGEIWNKESYNLWQKLSNIVGDKSIFLLEDDQTMNNHSLGFNFHFPLTMTWEDFYEGGYISASLLCENFYSYFMMGDSMNWLRYIETDGHKELGDNGEELIKCEDYLGINFLNPQIGSILVKLGFVSI